MDALPELFEPLRRAAQRCIPPLEQATSLQNLLATDPDTAWTQAELDAGFVQRVSAAQPAPIAVEYSAAASRLASLTAAVQAQDQTVQAALHLLREHVQQAWAGEITGDRRRMAAVLVEHTLDMAQQAAGRVVGSLQEMRQVVHEAMSQEPGMAGSSAENTTLQPLAEPLQNTRGAMPPVELTETEDDVLGQRAQPVATFVAEAEAAAEQPKASRGMPKTAAELEAWHAAQAQRAAERAAARAAEAERQAAAQQAQLLLNELHAVLKPR